MKSLVAQAFFLIAYNTSSAVAFLARKLLPPRTGSPTPTIMVKYDLWDKEVDIDIPKDVFPSDEEMCSLEAVFPNNMEHGWFESNGSQLHYRKFLPSGKPKGLIIWQHGIQAHSGVRTMRISHALQWLKANSSITCLLIQCLRLLTPPFLLVENNPDWIYSQEWSQDQYGVALRELP